MSEAKEKLPREVAIVALIIVLGALPPMFDSTIVNVAVNSLAKVFSANLTVIQWVVTGYVLAMGIAVPFSGWILKKFDGKKIYMVSLGVFMLGSLFSGLAWNVQSLIIFRIFQGLAAGVLIPTITTLVIQLGGSNNIGKIMSLVSIPSVFGPIIGPIIGGLILQYLHWSWLFFINLPIGAIGLILLQWKLPKFEAEDKKAKLDWTGVILLAIMSGTLIYGVTQVIKADSRTAGIIYLAVGAISFLIYIFYAFKEKGKALIPLNMFKSHNFSASFISLFLAGFATNGPMLLFPMLFQNVKGLSVIMSAMWLIPQGVGMLLTRSWIGKLTDKIGARYVALPAILITIIGTIPFAFFGANTSEWLIWLVLLVRGMGIGGYTIPVMSDSYVGLERNQVPTASVATRTIQNIGSAFGSAVLATVVSSVLAVQVSNLTGAYHTGFVTSIIFMLVGVVPALFLTNKIKKRDVKNAELVVDN